MFSASYSPFFGLSKTPVDDFVGVGFRFWHRWADRTITRASVFSGDPTAHLHKRQVRCLDPYSLQLPKVATTAAPQPRDIKDLKAPHSGLARRYNRCQQGEANMLRNTLFVGVSLRLPQFSLWRTSRIACNIASVSGGCTFAIYSPILIYRRTSLFPR